MFRHAVVLTLALAACGGGEPEKKPEEAKPAEEVKPAEEAKPAEAPAEARPDLTTASADATAWLMKTGENVYTTGGSGGIACTTCHGPEGKGTPPAFPPLAGSKKEMGDCKTHAGYVVHGLSGEITVQGTVYNGNMPAQGNLTDDEIAAVITFERQSWGNDSGPCLPADVAAARTAPAPTVPK